MESFLFEGFDGEEEASNRHQEDPSEGRRERGPEISARKPARS